MLFSLSIENKEGYMLKDEWDLDECKRWLGIGEKIYVKNQGSVEDFREWQALDKKYVGFDNHACLIEMCEKLREQLAEYIAKFGEIKK